MRYWMMSSSDWSDPIGPLGPPIFNKTINGRWIRYLNSGTSGYTLGTQSLYVTTTLSNFLGNALMAYQTALKEFGNRAQSSLGVNPPYTLQRQGTSEELAARYDLSLRSSVKTVKTRKPVINVECAGHPPGTPDLPLRHDRMSWPPWDTDPIKSTQWSVPSSDYTNSMTNLNSTIVNSSVIDISQFGDIKPSLGIFFSTPEVKTSGPGCPYCKEANTNTNYSSYTCTIDARWVETRAFSDASSGERAIFDFNSSPISDTFHEQKQANFSAPPMYMSQSWTESLTVPWMDDILKPVPSTNRTVFDIIGQRCLDTHT